MATHVEAQMTVQADARYRGLFEAAPDAMVVVDERGEIVLLNVQAEKQFGYSRDYASSATDASATEVIAAAEAALAIAGRIGPGTVIG